MVITNNSSSYDASDSNTDTDDDLKSNYQSTLSTTHHRKIYAFASRRPHDLTYLLQQQQPVVAENSSPSNVHYLRSHIMKNNDATMQIENACQMDLEAVPQVSRSSSSTIQRLDIERAAPHGSVFIREPECPVEENSLKQKVIVVNKDTSTRHNELINISMNGEGTSSLPGPSKKAKKNGKGLEGLGVISIDGQDIDLKFLACFADGAFNTKLENMTKGMETEDELLNFLNGLSGRWGSRRKRRKYVKASMLLKALPVHWEVLISLRPRVSPPSLYCRKFVSLSGVHFKSCKDVAFNLITESVTNAVNHPEERVMMQIENDCHVDCESDTATRQNEQKNIFMYGEGTSRLSGPSKKAEKDGIGLEGLGVINVDNEDIDLKFLACFADDEFNAKLKKMTERMEKEVEFLEFLNGLRGRWSSRRKRRKYVKAAMLLKVLPAHWDVLLSLRPRVRPRSLYCRKFVSPSGTEFSSCKDVALDLKSIYATHAANQPEQRAMMQVENDRQVDHEVVAQVPESSAPTAKVDLLGRINLKARCTLCLAVFCRQHLDEENSASSTSVVCPSCKEELNSRVKNASALYNQHANK